MLVRLPLMCTTLCLCSAMYMYDDDEGMQYEKILSPENPRCGICPSYFQKICGFNFGTNSTFIFDNQCIMDLYNCIHNIEFIKINYEHCVFFGNFGYVHGFKNEDYDYGEDHLTIHQAKKNPDFV